ncbi:hypothetical protein TPB0596_10140 [Tsukamurella pulmonis]|uniref:hypothetical protein n=1 Tax=Tsukamurella pulmonis TaxID=47312 RepID=UPI001EDE7209|nr:hypothetical protein [Tsukamurella pulmonis]BDD81251.1 hypothetical protein TPB0596_10140 [Tsukamurella pulmonis]
MNQDIWIIEGPTIDAHGEWEVYRGVGYFTDPDDAAAAAEDALVNLIRICMRIGGDMIDLGDSFAISGIDQATEVACMGARVIHLRPAGSPPPDSPRHIEAPGGPEAALAAAQAYMSEHAVPAETVARAGTDKVVPVVDPLELEGAVVVLGEAVEEAYRKARIVLHHLDRGGCNLTSASRMPVPELLAAVRRSVEHVQHELAEAHSRVFDARRNVKKLETGG